jgi:hypothetical protein
VARSVSGVPVRFHSFRLLEGGLARSACAYAGENVFLDVALAWTCGTPSTCPVQLRQESVPSSYSYRKLLSHFWRLVVSSGTRPLRAIAAAGILVAVSGLLVGGYFVGLRLTGGIVEPGWTSVMVVLLVLLGGLFIAVAVVAEYVGQAVRNTVGRPVYVRVDAPEARALHVLHTHLVAADEVDAREVVAASGVETAGDRGRVGAGMQEATAEDADGAGEADAAGGPGDPGGPGRVP